MKKNNYQSPSLEINEIRLATGICSAVNPPTHTEDEGVWEAPRRA